MSFTNFCCRSPLAFVASALFAISASVIASGANAFGDVTSFCRAAFNAAGVAVLAPCGRRMKQAMVRGIGQLQILYSIVRLVLVDVVNVFVATECATKMLLHDQAMFKDVLLVVPDKYVPAGVYSSSATPCRIFLTTEHILLVGLSALLRAIVSLAGPRCHHGDGLLTRRALYYRDLIPRCCNNLLPQAPATVGGSAKIVADYYQLSSAIAPAQPETLCLGDVMKRYDGKASVAIANDVESPCHCECLQSSLCA